MEDYRQTGLSFLCVFSINVSSLKPYKANHKNARSGFITDSYSELRIQLSKSDRQGFISYK